MHYWKIIYLKHNLIYRKKPTECLHGSYINRGSFTRCSKTDLKILLKNKLNSKL